MRIKCEVFSANQAFLCCVSSICCSELLPSDPFMWCGSIPAMAPSGPSEPGPIENWKGKKK